MGKIIFVSSVLLCAIIFLEYIKSVKTKKKDRGRSYPTNIITKRAMILSVMIRVGLVVYWFFVFTKGNVLK